MFYDKEMHMHTITGPPNPAVLRKDDNLNVGGAFGASQNASTHGHSGGKLGNMTID